MVKSKIALNGKLLIVAFYERTAAANGFSIPTCILYTTKKEYITLQNKEGKQIWKKSRICHVLNMKNNDKCVCMTEQDEKRIRSFLFIKRELSPRELDNIDRYINSYQDDILESARNTKKKQLANKVDVAMRAVPPLPKAFDRWIDREPLLHSRYIYYRRKTKTKSDCYCTHCKSDMVSYKVIPVHNEAGVCPFCGSKITFKAIGKSKKVRDEAYVCILQIARDGRYLLRFFRVERHFYDYYRSPETKYDERARLFFDATGNILGQYKNGWCVKTGRAGWYPTRDVITGKNNEIKWELNLGMYVRVMNAWFYASHLYPCNLRSMLTGLNLSYDITKNIKGRAVDVTTYLMRSMTYQFAPTLWRIGLARMGADLLEECFEPHVYHPAGSLHTRFGITKDFLRLMREHGLGMAAVNLRAKMSKEPSDGEFLWVLENKIDAKDLNTLTKYATYHKIKTYVEKQSKVRQRRQWPRENSAEDIVGFWKDYISMCNKLEYNLSKKSVLFPRNVKDEHDKVQQLIRIKHDPVCLSTEKYSKGQRKTTAPDQHRKIVLHNRL